MDTKLGWCELRLVPVEFQNRHQLSFICVSKIAHPHLFHQIEAGTVEGFLKATVTPYQDRDRIFYDVHGYRPLTETDFSRYTYEEWRDLFLALLQITQNAAEHILEGEHIILEPAYVFFHKSRKTFGLIFNEEYEVPFAEGMKELAGFFLTNYRPKEDKAVLLFYHFYHACSVDIENRELIEELKAQVYLERDELIRERIGKRIADAIAQGMAQKRAESPHKVERKRDFLPDKKYIKKYSGIVVIVCVILLLGGSLLKLFTVPGRVTVFLILLLILGIFGLLKALT